MIAPSRRRDGERLRAIHVIAGLGAADGGPSYSVPRLCQALGAADIEPTLLSVAGPGEVAGERCAGAYRERRFRWDCARLPPLNRLRLSTGLRAALRRDARAADVIHNHGLWLMPNVVAGSAAAQAKRPLVVSPRGMLAPAALAFSDRKKRAFWQLLQGRAVRQAACLHATSEQEYREIRSFGLTHPVAIIPNGIDLPQPFARQPPAMPSDRVVLSLGRIHPKKGLDRLLRAWAAIEAGHPGWRLRIVGPAEAGHDDALRALAARLGLARASIEGPLYGDAKSAAYRDADLFALPSLNENFGLTAAEALAAGTPVIATRGTPWSGLDAEGCGWWIDHGDEPLAVALANAMTLPLGTLSAMGQKGRAWMARDFGWERVARDTAALYRWLTGEAEPPATIRFG